MTPEGREKKPKNIPNVCSSGGESITGSRDSFTDFNGTFTGKVTRLPN